MAELLSVRLRYEGGALRPRAGEELPLREGEEVEALILRPEAGPAVDEEEVERLVRELERLERLEGDIPIRLPGALSELLRERRQR